MSSEFPAPDPNTDPSRTVPTPDEAAEALLAALIELEHYVGASGWDQPARLFALVETDDLIAAEPALAAQLQLRSSADSGLPGALTAIEQEEFHTGADLPDVLARIAWPDTVRGCALSLERVFLPAEFEADLPEDPVAAERFVAEHPQRQELRLIVGAVRRAPGADADPITHSLARLRGTPEELLSGTELAPGVSAAIAATLG
ncbi:PPA1309 family protein [Granulicoccus phenolivorans]|uniref:PPA1309 family protein n=1 Tax=Granulicoccus phenolivorans TaxID=266854 RepID=UPI00040E24E1|nr:PPA1309 family protein [Granulicoccus phenolivorans]